MKRRRRRRRRNRGQTVNVCTTCICVKRAIKGNFYFSFSLLSVRVFLPCLCFPHLWSLHRWRAWTTSPVRNHRWTDYINWWISSYELNLNCHSPSDKHNFNNNKWKHWYFGKFVIITLFQLQVGRSWAIKIKQLWEIETKEEPHFRQ